MKFVCVLSALLFSLVLGGKCDVYINGGVYIHKSQANLDETAGYQGCRKGCFDNGTITEEGARKCEKCSNIEDEELCRVNTRTCQWTKGGKCKSTSCSKIGKVYDQRVNTLAIKRCIEGDAQTQHRNNLYINEWLLKGNYASGIPNSVTGSYCEPVKRECEIDYNSTNTQLRLASLALYPTDYWVYRFYRTATEDNNAWQKEGLERCRQNYERCVTDCNRNYWAEMDPVDHPGMVAARKSCHVISGCMYSKSNNRCSVWAVWAFVLVLVIVILIALVAVGVVCFLMLSQDNSGSEGKPARVSDSGSSSGDRGGKPAGASDGSGSGGGDEIKSTEVSDVST